MTHRRALHLCAGWHHPWSATAAFWDDLCKETGLQCSTHEDLDAGCAALAQQDHDLLVVSALRWTMAGNERYAPHRAQWAYDIPAAARQAITGHLQRGGALLAVHAASISFDTWPEWEDMVGGRWVWGQSGHPPFGRVHTRITRTDHPLTQGVADFESQDEVYGHLRRAPDSTVLAESRAEGGDWMPTVWCHAWQGARVCYDALGHQMESFSSPEHRRLLKQAVGWLLDSNKTSGAHS